MELFTILTELLAVMMKLLNFSDIIDHIYDIIENGNAIIDRTDENVVYICAVIDHAGYIIYSSDEIMEFLSKIFNSHIDNYPYGSEQLLSWKLGYFPYLPGKGSLWGNVIRGTYRHHTSSNTCYQVQIMSENISHNYAITFQASEHCKGPYSKKPWRYNRPQTISVVIHIHNSRRRYHTGKQDRP